MLDKASQDFARYLQTKLNNPKGNRPQTHPVDDSKPKPGSQLALKPVPKPHTPTDPKPQPSTKPVPKTQPKPPSNPKPKTNEIKTKPSGNQRVFTVTATGLGKTVETAERNALQKAVRKALGEWVDAQTLSEKEDIIKDEVLTYSDGFVESRKVVNGPDKDPDLGLYTLTIEAVVVRSKVLQRLCEGQEETSTLDGANLLAEATTKLEDFDSGLKMLRNILSNEMDPGKVLRLRRISKGQGESFFYGDKAKVRTSVHPDKKGITLNFDLECSFDTKAFHKQIAPRLTNLLDKLCKRKLEQSAVRQLPDTKHRIPISNSICRGWTGDFEEWESSTFLGNQLRAFME